MVIVFYISGHGFGHATRSLEIINHLVRTEPAARVVVRTQVPASFVERSAGGLIEIHPCQTDTGVVQIDSLQLDETETARAAASFYRDFPERIEAEARLLGKLNAAVVVGDIPPLGFAAAERAGVSSIAVGNFTWDWIYSAYPDFERVAPGVIAAIGDAYARTSLALRLPFYGGFEPMRTVTLDAPLVARISKRGRENTRNVLGLDDRRPVLLISFGGHGARLPLEAIAAQLDMTLLATDHEVASASPSHSRLRVLTGEELGRLNLRYEDLVAAADAVVSKPGYGIVSECIANGSALLYTSRGHFAENDVMVGAMARVLRCRFISQEDLRAGRWAEAVNALLAQPAPPERMEANGAQVVAAAILAACCSAPES